jgi:hypothetical protein
VLDPADVLAVIPKLPLPAVQLEAPPLTPAGLAALPFVPAGFAAGSAVASTLDEVAPPLGWYTDGCICAIPAQRKTIAASTAIKNTLPVLAPLMV